ncbi:TetR/AcrR family transcriptional regulator [Pseudomonas neustonica]|uniref:TetR/AcrR family transcriptional regulator n=1 Tax=Pseudomonas neustonica TaxID=2487346 RepID=A0ABX9XI95_9PSED|nr:MULTISPECIES: TetR/AcrR family transcriptional regulator [Pseudomonas]MBA6419791.1 TetR/AcrR family transcriptional regulator [Pseudomonas sp. 5Ae-yellow]ROZ83033.1 TetR/AcrR family transcriptional regulator [Pseudomonas sp. SSM44]ROZ84869.1 TetR/AcrR family transcriptional regulator [Pseudomonas neustonica]|tara:strand:- start:7311 stop:7943 length:633 start_codon:yes stop_codon:yes gene_type:complete
MSRSVPKRRASSQERIERILHAARELLDRQGLADLSIYAIAEQAEIPPSSVYHFFPQTGDVLVALAQQVFVELDALLLQPLAPAPANWMVLVAELERRFQGYYQSNAAARELLLGAHELSAVRQADRLHDRQLGRRFQDCLEAFFSLPVLPAEVDIFTLAMQAADKLLAVDYQQHGELTPAICQEATRMMTAYLGLYLPALLPPASEEMS